MAQVGIRTITSYNPATGEALAEVPVAGEAEIAVALQQARAAQPAWAALPIRERARVLRAFRRQLLTRAEWLTDLISCEQGRPRIEALVHEVMCVCDLIGYYTTHARRFLADEHPWLHLYLYKRGIVQYVPYGVVAVIAPWNFPFLLPTSEVTLALLAGNAVILKPSELTPLVGAAIAELFAAAGLPEGVLQVVQGDGATGAALVHAEPDGPDKIAFIGGAVAGQRILEGAARHLTPVTLELGGKDPLLVLRDADLDRAAQIAVWGGLCNAGQACAAVERIYVAREVADAFIARVVGLVEKLRLGATSGASGPDGPRDAIDIGPMTSERQLEIVAAQVEQAVAQGARTLVGGKRRDGRGFFYEPTVLVDVRDEMAVMREETFGPVLAIATFATEDEAIARANATPYGLCAAIFSRDRRRARRLASRIHAGGVMINDVALSYAAPELPWGGFKRSGIGRVHWGAHGLRDYCQPRAILHEWLRPLPRDLWEFPYGDGIRTYRRFLQLARLLW
ncbi:MAG: aldehyde dehydrogenase family protein, partial [Ktedonobacterales bacterium]